MTQVAWRLPWEFELTRGLRVAECPRFCFWLINWELWSEEVVVDERKKRKSEMSRGVLRNNLFFPGQSHAIHPKNCAWQLLA